MNFIEFIAFVITLGAMIVIFIKRFLEERGRQEKERQKNPKLYAERERERQLTLKKLYRSLEGYGEDEDESEYDIEEEREEKEREEKEKARVALAIAARRHAAPIAKQKKQGYIHTPPAEHVPLLAISKPFQTENASQKRYNVAQQGRQFAIGDAPKYDVIRDARDSRGGRLIQGLHSPQEMLILKEIFDKPLAIRDQQSADQR